MASRNQQLSHLVEHPCRQCGTPTKALNAKGQIELRPICPTCRAAFEAEFKKATAQRKRQNFASAARQG